MLSRSGPLPYGQGWSYEPKWDGFRAIVSTLDGLSVRSRRGWQMRQRVPELADLPPGLVLDGELVAFEGPDPWFPHICERILHGRDRSVLLVVFDLLAIDGVSLLRRPYFERREQLETLRLHSHAWQTSPRFDDGQALMSVIVERGWEGVVAKKLSGTYRPGHRDWVKTKNKNYWRYEQERALVTGFRSRSPLSAEAY
jgi:bifunctional non-homologous end joining protein LigD